MTDGIVTGEGVLLEARPVSFAPRRPGGFIDAFALLMLLQLVVTLSGLAMFALGDDAAAGLMLVSIVLSILILPVTFETLTRGRSLGKLCTGVRIVRDDGGPIRLRQAF